MNTLNLVTQIRAHLPHPDTADEPSGADLILAIYQTLNLRNQALLEHIALMLVRRQASKS